MADSRDIHTKTYRKKPPLPIDRGWAWCVLIGVYFSLLILTSFARSLSIFLPDILDRYKESAAVTTLAFGMSDLCWSLTNVFMPIFLLPRFSVRTLVLSGAFSHCFGIIALAYSSNIIVFNCLFGVLGAAAGLVVCPSTIHLGHYFKKRLSFASSVAQIGGSTATILVPGLAQYLKDVYGYQGAILIIGGISFNCVAAAMLLWPVSMFDTTDYTKEVQDNSSNKDFEEKLDIDGVQKECNLKPLGKKQEEEEEIDVSKDAEINEESKFLQDEDLRNSQIKGINYALTNCKDNINGHVQFERNCEANPAQLIPLSEARVSRDTSQRIQNEIEKLSSRLPDLALDSQVNRDSENNTQKEQFVSCHKDDSEKDSNATLREPQENNTKCDQADEDVHRSTIEETVSNEAALIQDVSNHKQDCTTPSTSTECCSLQKMKAFLSSSVLLNPVAVMLIIAGGLSTPGGLMYMPVLGLENGLSPGEIPWMLTAMGIADIFGKLGIGFFADMGYVRPIRIACMSQLIVGLACQFTTFYKGLGPMIGVAVIIGMMNGVVHSLLSPMVVELLGLQYLAQVTPVVYLAMGLVTFVFNVTVGAIKDATGSFFGGFNFLGGMMLTTFVVLLLEPVFVRCSGKFSKNENK